LKIRAPRNRTIILTPDDKKKYGKKLQVLKRKASSESVLNKTFNQDLFEVVNYLPEKFIDLLFIDPPYNLSRKFNSVSFSSRSSDKYAEWLDSFIKPLIKTLKDDASIYICGDWRSAVAVQTVMNKYFTLRNRITWEREKGRGSKVNWKNNSEDIWYYTVGDTFKYFADEVKIKRKVLAPYKNKKGEPKDWHKNEEGNFRLTFHSNIWTDISVPFWSMPENTDHPTQKPEKLLAKIILASSEKNDVVFDPFLGSGTTSVTAKKLGRNYCGVELDEEYALLCEKRLDLAETDSTIQGYNDGVFWERNSSSEIIKNRKSDVHK